MSYLFLSCTEKKYIKHTASLIIKKLNLLTLINVLIGNSINTSKVTFSIEAIYIDLFCVLSVQFLSCTFGNKNR